VIAPFLPLKMNKLESKLSPTANQTAGWVALVLGVLAFLVALSLLMVSLFIGVPAQLIIPGLIQLGIGIFLIAAKWIVPNNRQVILIIWAILLLVINAAFGFWFGIGSLVTPGKTSSEGLVLTVRDPDSPIVVSIKDSRGLLQNRPIWSGTISADGIRPTQYTGWPTYLVGDNANPTKLIWHNDNPDWVEIRLDTGQSLKLTWDSKAAFDARLIRDLHYFLNPEFELIR
jgi:hypothetical protein